MSYKSENAPPRIQKIKDKQNLTGRGRTEWKYFSKLDEILGTRPATHPPVLLETHDSQPLLSDHDSDETDVEEVQEGSVQDHSGVTDDHNASDNQNCSGNSTVSVSGAAAAAAQQKVIVTKIPQQAKQESKERREMKQRGSTRRCDD